MADGQKHLLNAMVGFVGRDAMRFVEREHLISVVLLIATLLAENTSGTVVLFFMFCCYIAYEYGDFIYRSYLTLGRDLSGLKLLLNVKYDLHRRLKANRGVHELFLELVRKHPDKLAVQEVGSERQVSFRELNELGNRFAHYFQRNGYKKGDVVALFMENSIEFVACWIGLSKLGVITAWVNSSLKTEQLAHCINTSGTNAVVCSRNLAQVLYDSQQSGSLNSEKLRFYVCDLGDKSAFPAAIRGGSFTNLSSALDKESTDEPTANAEVNFKDVLCFIYTSGTTGMPKAAVMKHFSLYISMPLYHTSAGIIGIGQMVLRGSSAVLRTKFSASNFWRDCVKYECTASQYIGEICRYLLAQVPVPEERQHKMRLMYGNGLRMEIWEEFVNRFKVQIGELYGSTEGTSNLVNIDGKVGACGFLPISPLTSRMHPVRLVKVDESSGDVIRGPDGLCVPCRPGETGAMVSTIRRSNPLLIFEGYLNESETNKKVLHNVFRQGDSVFLSGDILHWDRLGYVYFRDRTGDTFRWKGENVSTTEVEKAFYTDPKIRRWISDVTVYGVKVPNTEGRAGMAAVSRTSEATVSDEEFLGTLAKYLRQNLIGPAVPLFIRICSDVQRTGTYKLVKTQFQNLGLEPGDDNDALFFYCSKSQTYLPLNDDVRNGLRNGTLGF
ncbi:Long-chain fatty acid transport protein 4 [Aphelenchoides fujianensis]|nr:Long-chain fatty acid transport protein 4 [Aphelenchoides fujianensis]